MWLLHPTSFPTKSTSRGNAWLGLRAEEPSCLKEWPMVFMSWSPEENLGTVQQTLVASAFLAAEIQPGVQRGWVLSQVIALSSPLNSRDHDSQKTDLIALRAEVKLCSVFPIENYFFEHAKVFCTWQNTSLMWSCLVEENLTSSRIAKAQFPTDKPRAQTTACFFVKT